MPSSRPMAIASILGPTISGYSPSLRYTSSKDPHATRPAQAPSSKVNPPSPVEDPASPARDAEIVAAGMVLQAMRHESAKHNAAESLLQLHTEGDPLVRNAAKSLLQLRIEADVIFLKTSTEQCECDDYNDDNVTFCEHDNCLSGASPPDVARPEIYPSDHPSDEDPLPSAVPKKTVTISCHDNQLHLHAREGNALFDLPLNRQDDSSSSPCRRCERLQDISQKSWYAEEYRKLGSQRFEGEDTISLDDDSEDSTPRGQHGAADDTTKPKDPAIPSPRPKLRLTINKLAWEKATRGPEPESLSSETSTSDSDDDADDLPPSSSNTSISLASPPSAHDPRPKNGTTTSPLKQVENASSSSPSPSQRDPPPSAKTNENRPLYALRNRANLRRPSSKGRDLANDAGSNGVPQRLALPAREEKEKKEVAVTDTASPLVSRPWTRAQGRRIMAREVESME